MNPPAIIKNYDGFPELVQAMKKFNECLSLAHNEVDDLVKNEKLPADLLVKEIFKSANIIETGNIVYERAIKRREIGNPPGKNNDLGDSINWEIMLKSVPEHEDLYIISGDGDY